MTMRLPSRRAVGWLHGQGYSSIGICGTSLGLTKEAIELYCRSVGETHPVYFDEAYARTTRYGGLIAPPSPA